jgi:hypothetical protein
MEKKFVLTEEESKRILTLHKKKIEEERLIGESLLNERSNDLSYVVNEKVSFESAAGKTDPELTIYKGAKFVPDNKGNLVATTMFNFADTLSGQITKGYDSWVTVDDENVKMYTYKDKVIYNCKTYRFTVPNKSEYEYFAENSPAPELVKELTKLCKKSDGGGSTTTSKCPKIEKWFKDNGFVMITKQRYYQLANDNTRIRKYKYCPISKTNLFFAKVKGATQGGGGETRPITGGGGTVRYGFNYQDALKALKSKGCSVTGGGASDEENFADDWRSTENQKQTVNTTVSKENIQSWAS